MKEKEQIVRMAMRVVRGSGVELHGHKPVKAEPEHGFMATAMAESKRIFP